MELIIRLKNVIIKVFYFLIILYLVIYIPLLWGYKPLVVVSGSMEPILKVGGILYYKNIDLKDFKKEDILVYKTPNHIVSHRIVDINKGNFITKGDANNNIDGVINRFKILGRGTNFCIPIIGYYADFVYNHKFILVISFGLVVIDLVKEKYLKEEIRLHESS